MVRIVPGPHLISRRRRAGGAQVRCDGGPQVRGSRGLHSRLPVWVLLAAIVAGLAGTGLWWLDGGRWQRVSDPSMGTAAPVGTLLWVRPADFATLRVGELVTFHPPGRHDVTYTHRVYSRDGDGTVRTKADLDAPDPWRLSKSDIVGKVAMRWWGIGWLVKAAPVLLAGALLLALLDWRLVRRGWRLPTTLLGGALVLSLAVIVYRPLTRAQQLRFVPTADGARATYVSTGLLPLRMRAPGGRDVVLRDGQVGSVVSTQVDGHGRFPVSLHPEVSVWWWVALVVICLLPALWAAVFGSRSASRGHVGRHESS